MKAKLHIKIVFSTCFFVFNKHRISIFVFKIKELNYLAHQVLSFKNPNLMIGNFIADSIQGNRFDGLNEDIIKGIKLHRKIDTFTDSQPYNHESVSQVQATHAYYRAIKCMRDYKNLVI